MGFRMPSRDFWDGARTHALVVGYCAGCRRYQHPSVVWCASCRNEVVARSVSGDGHVVAVTVNHHRWTDWLELPYVVAIVTLDDAPGVRLTTNIVACEPEDVVIGLSVRVRFVERAGLVVPAFAPRDDDRQVGSAVVPEPLAPGIRRQVGHQFEDDVAVTGIGSSAVGRGLDRSPRGLVIDACLAAMDDAGLSPAEVDGLCGYPGPEGMPGLSQGGVRAVMQDLGIRPIWHAAGSETPGQTGPVIAAMLAVSAGLCRHVLCVSATAQSAPPAKEAVRRGPGPFGADDELQWRLPYGAVSPAHWIALSASHYLHRYGVDRSALGWVAITARDHATRNPDAVFRTPLSMDDYLDARVISTPFGLYDCDVPCDGAYAVVISRRDEAANLRQPPVRVEAVGTRIEEPQSWDQGTLTHQPNVFGPARHLWSRTDLRPADVKAAQLYDGFTFNALTWLEALGFCGIGEAGDFVDGGRRIGRGGDLPLNTHGGQLSAGRSNGYGALLEAVRQIRGTAGGSQVEDADVVVASSGGGIPANCLLLTAG